MSNQEEELKIREMNGRLKSILQGMYKFQELGPDIKMRVAYASDKGIYLDDGVFLSYEKTADTESIERVVEYVKNKRSVVKTGIIEADSLIKDNRLKITKDMLISLIGFLVPVIPSTLISTIDSVVNYNTSAKTSNIPNDIVVEPEAIQAEGTETRNEEDYFEISWFWITRTLQNNQCLKNCYISPYSVLHTYNGEDCLKFYLFQTNSDIDLYLEKYCFLTTTLNLFARYASFVGTISAGNRQVWEQLWNDEAILLNAAQQVLREKCGTGIAINSLGILCSMTYEGKPLQGEIFLGSVSEDIEPISLDRAIEFNVDNLRQICKLVQLCQFGYAMMLDVGDGEDSDKITTLVNMKKAEQDKKTIKGKICFFNGKGWYLYKGKDALLEYRNGKFLLPGNEINRKDMISKLEQYFDLHGIWEELVSMIIDLEHGAMIIVTSEAEKEAKRLTEKNRGYKVKCEFNKELFSGFTCVDGALIISPSGDCEAFGVIIDGKAVTDGNVERGSRYNSAKNYIAWKKKKVEEKKCEARYAAIVRSDDGNMDIFIL